MSHSTVMGADLVATAERASESVVARIDKKGSILSFLLYGLFRSILSLLYWLITFATITLPTWIFKLGSQSWTLTLNFTTILIIFVIFGSAVSWVVRYRYLNMYARLPPEPQRKDPSIDFVADSRDDGNSLPGMNNYLDEFLSAIKVFGYLERHVFHELTRTMQTRKLIAGETLLLEEEKGFCLVVDGLIQIFVRSNQEVSKPEESPKYFEDEHKMDGHDLGYQLLTEVKNGAAMSSLFSVLSLFTEDVKLRHDGGSESESFSTPLNTQLSSKLGESPISSAIEDLKSHAGKGSQESPKLPPVPHLSLDESRTAKYHRGLVNHMLNNHTHHNNRKSKSAHPDIIGRAKVDTMIAIIPAAAFRRLTRVYPKATAHIVQVIISRLQRVTLANAYSYLGLTSEVLQVEKLMERYTYYDLPNHLRGDALERLKIKFQNERSRLGSDEDTTKGIALHNPHIGRRRRRSLSAPKKDILSPTIPSKMRDNFSAADGADLAEEYHSKVDAGDLQATVQGLRFSGRPHRGSVGRKNGLSGLAPFNARDLATPLSRDNQAYFERPTSMILQRQQSYDEDEQFRLSILRCMTKAIGFDDVKSGITSKGVTSADHSPRLVSYDARRQHATFTNAFGDIGSLTGSIDGESESTPSISGHAAFSSPNFNIGQELIDDIEIVFFPKDAVLVEQGERNPGLYYVIDGFLDVGYPIEEQKSGLQLHEIDVTGSRLTEESSSLPTESHSARSHSIGGGPQKPKRLPRQSLFMVKPGGLAGYVGSISGYRSFIDVRAKTDVYVGFLPREALERIIDKYPILLLTLAKRLTHLLPRLILHIDFALEWVQIDAGELLHHQGDESDAIYIVLNGRLRAISEKESGEKRVVGEFGQSESVGELEVMTESVRPATIHAIRDTELAKLPKTLFNSLSLEHPGITIKVSKMIAQRMRSLIEDPLFEQGKEKKAAALGKHVTSSQNLRTIAILPVASGVPVTEFGNRLLNALTQIGVPNGVISLTQTAILNHLGRHAFSRMGRLKLSQYLADLEERYGMLLYVADTSVTSPWTKTCINQADCILLIGLAEASPDIGEYERFLFGTKSTARKELVLLHLERYSTPGLTRKWLQNRVWINGSHHHIQMAFRTHQQVNPQIKRIGTSIKQRVQTLQVTLQAEIQKYTSRRIRETPLYSSETPFKGDFHRLARRLCGKSVGLVLGGGGARGMSHIGVIRALEEAGIPIDIVGGTSIGAFIGALYARDADVVPVYGRAKKFAGRMGSMWRFALDLTYPSASYTTGHEFNRGIFKALGDSQIEDFWLDFYCNTTNISKSRSEIHTSGYAWRYVRASMSLAGLIPPLCDEGSMLVDGGYVDNLTVAHMKSLGADTVFAVDVGSLDDDTPQTYGDSLSGLWSILNRWNPFSNYPNPPTLSEIQARLAYVSSVDALERAKTTPGCLYMRPPIDVYGTLDFVKFDEIYEVGYAYAVAYLERLRERGVLPRGEEESEEGRKLRRTMAPRRASI
ncbi:MAG: phosphatidylcholine and lysophosphatidylcholine phospholipase [Gomphillus americanus]|uniref:Lysophospholipase NTE1 n=1 Tax=Gomphillus americanus TaxID=1940652 RepID=A0A8H3FKQ4_9LECA|nr:MAG: phosphatidylcholine and lysophosphatidylcholine phospholipase [Gomphillus americanus]